MEAIARQDGHKSTRSCQKCGRELRAPRKELKPGEELPDLCYKCGRYGQGTKKPSQVIISAPPFEIKKIRKLGREIRAAKGEFLAISNPSGSTFKEDWQKWMASEQGKYHLDLSTLTPGPYLENRLHNAFAAGYNARLH